MCIRDSYYGTLLKPVIEKINKGFKVILEIEVNGAEQIRKKFPDALSIFLMPPSKNELEKRIRNRGTENEESIIKRLERASFEIDSSKNFDHVITNLDVEETVKTILEVIYL